MHPFLPKLKSSTDSDKTLKLAAFDRRGFWRVGGNIDLSDLSSSLEIDTIDPNYIEVDSVPDMWARPILFGMAFFNKGHLLHQRFIEEWRGLLAMLALKEIRNLQIDAAEVRIPRRDQQIFQNEEERKLAETAPDFIQALADLAPKHFIAADSDWHRLYVILFRGRPIGMTSPTTLVCTAVNYMNRIFDVTWFNGRLLEDPTPYLNDYEKMSLVSWLEKLKENLSNHNVLRENQFMRNDIIKEIGSFQLALGRGERIDPANLSGTGLHLEHGIFAYLDKPVKIPEELPEDSHVKLQPSRTNPEPSPALLVIDREISKQWGIPEQDVVVIGSTTLGSMPYGGLKEDRTRFGDKTLRGAEWRKPEMFFTRKLFYVAQKNAFPGALEVHGMRDLSFKSQVITPILPIQPWLLKYLTLDDLRRRFTFARTNDGIIASLTLPLRGKDGKGKDFIIKKEYRNADNELQRLDQPPVLEVWPNFKAANWKAYYTYYARERYATTFFTAIPVAPGAQFESQADELIKCKTLITGERLEKITRLDRFPEAFECFVDIPTSDLNKFETVPAGLILLQQPSSVRQADDWKIGIDFGTTGTNVFYAVGEGEPRPFKFDDHFFQVTDSSAELRTDTIYYRFVAGKKNAITPFLTIYHDFLIANPATPILRPLLDGHIFFKSKDAEFKATSEGMYTNLKWGNTVEDRKRSLAFLTQLCLQCAAEAVNGGARFVSWRYSFPTAFSAGETLYFKQAWNQIIELCNNLTGVNTVAAATVEGGVGTEGGMARDAEALKPMPKTESVASGQFFADKPDIRTEASFGNKGVCLDVGGGTSDISVWYDNQLSWQASIRYAGRDMLLNLFYQNPVFLKLFETETDLELLTSLASTKEEYKFYAQLDVSLKEKGEAWLKNLHIYTGEPAVKGFIQLMALSLSGLTFYVGQVLGALRGDKQIKFPAEIPNVFIGGNGARMFDWLAGGSKFDNKSPVTGLFKAMVLAGSEFKAKESDFKICTSPEPKSEVAYGLVSDRTKLKGTDQQNTLGMIAGERFVEKGIAQPWQQRLTAERLHNGIECPDSLEQFQKFLDTFKNYTKSPNGKDIIKTLEDDDDALRDCRNDLAHKLASAKSGKLEDVHVEPFFIFMLKHFLDIKTKQWAKTQKPV